MKNAAFDNTNTHTHILTHEPHTSPHSGGARVRTGNIQVFTFIFGRGNECGGPDEPNWVINTKSGRQ